jgi:hypothetical protein
MSANSWKALSVLFAAALACSSVDSGGSSVDPHPTQVTPGIGYIGTPTPVVIAGTGFLVKPSGGTTHRAWLKGDNDSAPLELASVTWTSDAATCGTATPPCLTATVPTSSTVLPTGLIAGMKKLTVENALGLQGSLDNAFQMLDPQTIPAVGATISASPTASTNQAFTLTLQLAKTGSNPVNVTAVTLNAAAAAICGGLNPALPQNSIGASLAFTWSCTAPATAQSLSLNATVTWVDTTNSSVNQTTTPATAAAVTVQTAAVVTVPPNTSNPPGIAVSPATVSTGQNFTVTLTLNKTGTASAVVSAVVPDTITNVTCGAVTSPSGSLPMTIPSGTVTRTFTWTCNASAPGTVSLNATVTWKDVNAGIDQPPLRAGTPVNVSVQSTASLTSTIAATPGTVSVGQAITLTLTIDNGGQSAANITSITPTHTGATATCSSPTIPTAIPGGGFRTSTWTCTPTAAGALTLGANVVGADANNPLITLTTSPATVAVTVQPPSALTATISPSRNTVSGTQQITVTFRLTNGVTSAPAVITGIAPSVTGSASCGAVNQSLPQTIPTNGYMDFTWFCTPNGTAGTLTLSGTANGHDGNNPSILLTATPATAASVTVQTPAALSATAVASLTVGGAQISSVSTGQTFVVTLNVTNTAPAGTGASATINGVTLTPNSPIGCGAVGQSFPQTIAGGATMAFTWNCSAATEAANVFVQGSASGQDANSNNSVSTSASAFVTVQAAATLTGVLTAPSPVSTGQAFTLTLTFTKGGTAQANVTGVTNPTNCANPTPATRTNVATGNTITWTCTAPGTAQTLSLGTTVSWVDANNPGTTLTFSPTAASVVVQAAATLTGVLSAPSPVSTGQSFTLTLTFTKGGTPQANVTGVTNPTNCTNPTPATLTNVATGNTITWSCTAPGTAQTLSLGTTVSWVDANSPSTTLTFSPTAASVTVQAAAALTAAVTPTAVSTSQAFTLTATFTKTGTSQANVTGVTSPSGCTPTSATTITNVATGNTITWSCTAPGSAGSISLTNLAQWVDANVPGTTLNLTPTPSSVTVAAAATLTATATPATVSTSQAFTLTATFTKGGTAQANVTGVTSPSGCTPTSATTITNVATGNTITWNCTAPGSAGSISLTNLVQWVDANVPGTTLNLTPTPSSVTVAAAATLTAAATPTTVSTSQGFTLTATFTKGGTAQANVTGVTSPSGCTPTSATTITNVATGNTITWSCTAPGSAGSISLTNLVQWVDVNHTGTTLNLTPTPASVTVVAAATLTATATPTTVSTSQGFTLTATFTKGGTAQANVTGVTSPSGCTPTSATTITNVATGNTITWSCTAPASAGSVSLTNLVQWVDVNHTGTTLNLTPTPASVTVAAAATLTATAAANPALLSVNQAFTLTATFTKGGTAQANVTGVTSPSGCTPTSATTITNVATGNTVTWSCTAPASSGSVSLSNLVQWVDANNAGTTLNLTPTPSSVTIQAHPVLTGSISASASAGTISVVVNNANADTASAGITGVTLNSSAGGTCTVSPSGFPITIAAPLGTTTLSWSSCTGITAGGNLSATVAAVDANDNTTNVSQTFTNTAGALMADAGSEVTLVTTDPFSDGAPFAFVAAYQDLPWVGPSRDGSTLARIDLATSAVTLIASSGSPGAAALLVSTSASDMSWLAQGLPSDPAWAARTSLPSSGQFPGDRAVPASASFGTCADGSCVYLARNVVGGSSEPTTVPQLWRCSPSAGQCAPGDWTLAASNGSGDLLLSQLGQATNGALSMLVATPRWLYLGFDNLSTGLQLYRASATPQTVGDFRGASACTAGSTGCQGLGGNGFGDASLTRFFDAKVMTIGGATSLWLTVGDGSGPVRVYRVDDVADAGLLASATTDTATAQAAAQGGCSTGGGFGLLAALVVPLLLRRRRHPSP